MHNVPPVWNVRLLVVLFDALPALARENGWSKSEKLTGDQTSVCLVYPERLDSASSISMRYATQFRLRAVPETMGGEDYC